MKKNRYRISVERLDADETAEAPEHAGPLRFTARCHDDIFAIVARVRQGGMLDEDDSAAMAVGLKLLGEIAIERRNDPLFKDLFVHLGAFIKKLKAGGGTQAAAD